MQDIACVILTKDEELHIERCIRSAQVVCKDIWVIDSFSSDRTCEMAEALGAHVVQHKFENQAAQFNWAIDTLPIVNAWIWRLDADEVIDPELASLAENNLLSLPDNVNGVYVNKKIVFMGRPLLHGGWYPAPQIKIVRRGYGRSEDKLMDEHLIVTSGDTVYWNGDQTDWNLNSLDWWWKKHQGYAKREALMLWQKAESEEGHQAEVQGKLFGTDAERKRWMKNLYRHFPPYVRPIIYFIGRYILLLGFLDGYAGWYWHTRQGLKYRMLVDYEYLKLKRNTK